MPWFKGNIHCHSSNSDGDLSPRDVAACYHRAGYHFLVITDHNHLTDPSEAGLPGDDFLLIPGMEFTYDVEPSCIHINGIGLKSMPKIGGLPADLIRGMKQIVDSINKQQAFSMINHPNWHWAYGYEEMARVPDAHAFEVYNGAPTCNNEGDSKHPSTDMIWDRLLSRGIHIYGVACDDAHDYNTPNPVYAEPPFTGWICVQSDNLSKDAIMKSLFDGNFYASNHPVLTHMLVQPGRIEIRIKEIDQIRYTTSFIGKNGNLLKQVHGLAADYTPMGNEGYIRAVVKDTGGHKAWIQPLFL